MGTGLGIPQPSFLSALLGETPRLRAPRLWGHAAHVRILVLGFELCISGKSPHVSDPHLSNGDNDSICSVGRIE